MCGVLGMDKIGDELKNDTGFIELKVSDTGNVTLVADTNLNSRSLKSLYLVISALTDRELALDKAVLNRSIITRQDAP